MDREGPPEGIESIARPDVGNLLRVRFPDRTLADEEFDMSPPISVLYLGIDDLRGNTGLDHRGPARFQRWG